MTQVAESAPNKVETLNDEARVIAAQVDELVRRCVVSPATVTQRIEQFRRVR